MISFPEHDPFAAAEQMSEVRSNQQAAGNLPSGFIYVKSSN
jgi:hypothetical protein